MEGVFIMSQLFEIPENFINVSYNPKIIPNGENQPDLTQGANCQVYAYELLRYFGKNPPLLRSSELWSDEQQTKKVVDYERLDLMLYNKTPQSYGAHVGVYVGNGMVLHLSQEVGYPVIQHHDELILNKKYTCFIGVKRVLS